MNNKSLLLSAHLKVLLAKEDMNVDSAKLLNDKIYATSVLRKALTSNNTKIIEIAKNLIVELKLDLNGGGNNGNGFNMTNSNNGKTLPNIAVKETEAERLQKLKEKYKKDSGRN